MTAIPKALAMANPKHVVACVATVAGAIASKFAIDTVCNERDGTKRYTNTKKDERESRISDYNRELNKCFEAY